MYCAIGLWKFQFHEGPIKTELRGSRNLDNSRFNSMKVRLKRLYIHSLELSIVCFNSMKVRLKRCPSRARRSR